MTPLSKVVSLKTAKRLKDAGFPQDTERWWDEEDNVLYRSIDRSAKDIGCVAAPDSQEVGELLPAFNPDGSAFQQLTCIKNRNAKGDEYSVRYQNHNRGGISKIFFAPSEAEARAACWLYLKENNLL